MLLSNPNKSKPPLVGRGLRDTPPAATVGLNRVLSTSSPEPSTSSLKGVDTVEDVIDSDVAVLVVGLEGELASASSANGDAAETGPGVAKIKTRKLFSSFHPN